MGKSLLATVVMVSVMSASAYSAQGDGRVNFTGKIINDGCTVVNTINNPLEVNLGTVSSTAFTTAGDTAAPTKFTIKLKDCPTTYTSANVSFDGEAEDNDGEVLKLTQGAGVAKNVGVEIRDLTNKVVPLHTRSSAYPLVVGDNNLDFTARYRATADVVDAGDANATTDFTIIYN